MSTWHRAEHDHQRRQTERTKWRALQHHPRVEAVENYTADLEGYHILLVPGWHYDDMHTIVEFTLDDCADALAETQPCVCDFCGGYQ